MARRRAEGQVRLSARIGYVLPPFPVRSETFVAGEVRRLVDAGVPLVPIVLSSESTADAEPLADLRASGVRPWYLGTGRSRRLMRYAAGYVSRDPGGAANAYRTSMREPVLEFSRTARWLKVIAVAELVHRWNLVHLHSHWTLPTDVALIASELTSVGFSFSTHAHDIFEDGPSYERQRPGSGLGSRVARASFVPTCTAEGQRFLERSAAPEHANRIKLIYHGVDLALFDRTEPVTNDPPHVVSVGRLVAYKGFDDVIRACAALLERGIDLRCTIAGDGTERQTLERMVSERRLGDRIRLVGPLSREDVRDLLATADAYVMCGKADQGQYGLPNVLLEAAAMATPSVSLRLPSTGELVKDGVNGMVADSLDELTNKLKTVLTDPDLRRRLGAAARVTVEEVHDASRTVQPLISELTAAAAAPWDARRER